MWKKLNLSSDGGDSGSKKYKQDCGGDYGIWQSLHLIDVWSKVISFMLVHLGEIWLQLP
jgi:hypothetical protein